MTPTPGIYRDIPFDVYSAWDAARFSALTHFRKTALHARHYLLNGQESTAEMALGWATHVAILEPERFEREFAPAPKLDKRTKVGKQAWADLVAATPDRQLILQPEWDKCVRMRDAVRSHPTASEILGTSGVNEVSLLWHDAETKLPCKARLDWLGSYQKRPLILDLKTSRSAARRDWERSVQSLGYHEQAAQYLEGASALAPLDRLFVWVVVESEEPHAVAVYEIEDAALSQGRDEYRKHLRMYAECLRTGSWPGYPDGIDYAGLPAWAYRSIED